MKTNLLLIDTLKNMENLIHSGFALSNQLKRKLKIVYVMDFNWVASNEFVSGTTTAPTIDSGIRVFETQIRENYDVAEEEIRRIISEYLKKYPQNVPYELDVVENSRLQIIEKTIEDEKDVLLLMSNYNSYSGISNGVVNYPNIMDKVACPVLIVPDDIETVSINSFLYATALHAEDLKAIKHLCELMEGADGKKLTVFHNMKETDSDSKLRWSGFKALVKESVTGFNVKFEHSNEENVREGLKNYLANESPGVIVLLKEKKGFFKDLFSSSQTHYVVTHYNKPVLVYHEENLK